MDTAPQTTLITLATVLAQLYRERAALNLTEWQITKDIQARELALTPADGWPGKNEAARETAMRQAFAADETLSNLNSDLFYLKRDQAVNEGEREAREAERRAYEWQIRQRLCDALQARGIVSTGDDSAFDEVTQQASDQLTDTVVIEEYEIPF